jgi:hypothetical protein
MAAAKIGAITVALNWRLSPFELHHCVELTKPKMLITQPGLMDNLYNLTIGPDYEAALAASPAGEPETTMGGEDGLIIIFTSGTTGLPKGALVSHRAMISRTGIYGAETGAPAKDTFVAWTPLFHMGSNDFTFATLLRGGKVVVVDGYQPQLLADIVETEMVHYLTVIPGMIMDFIEVLKERKVRPKFIGMIGAMADHHLVACPVSEHFWINGNRHAACHRQLRRHWRCPHLVVETAKRSVRNPPGRRRRQRGARRRAGRTGHSRTVIVQRLLEQRGRQRRGLSRQLVSHGGRLPAQSRWYVGFRRPG